MTVSTDEMWRLSAGELAAAVRSRQASSEEVVSAHLERIAAVNPTTNAVTLVLAEAAREAARDADRAVAEGAELGRFHGVPFTVKIDLDLAGTPTTMGARSLVSSFPKRDAPMVERMRRAGGIPIGRTNMATLGMRLHTHSELAGPTVNPWDPARTPGGSSGGDAAAVATGMAPLGLGGDTGGSLRWPAQCCGVATLKPSLGRIPRASSIDPADPPISTQLMGVEGPLARRVADLRMAFEVLAGPTWRDAWSVPAPLRGPAPARPIHVALVLDPARQGVDRSVKEGVVAAGKALEAVGYAVEELEPPHVDKAAKAAVDMLNPDWHLWWHYMSQPAEEATRRYMSALLDLVGAPDPMTTTVSFMTRAALIRAWGEFQETYPLVVAPISTSIPFEVGADLTPAGVAEIHRAMRMALAVNALALPAVVVPVGVAQGLPQAVQVIAPRYREDLCLDAADAIEEGLGVLTPIDPRPGR